MDDEKVAAFLADLSELSRRHGIKVGACGCCGSPWLFGIKPEQIVGHYVLGRPESHDQLEWKPGKPKPKHGRH